MGKYVKHKSFCNSICIFLEDFYLQILYDFLICKNNIWECRMDRIIRGFTKDKSIRFFAIDSTKTVKKAVKLHNLSITNSVIMGRMLSATLMMAKELKSDKNNITLKINCDGAIGNVIVTANKNGFVKGYITNPQTEIPLAKETKSIDVKRAIGNGNLTIIKDLGLESPYIGQIEMKYGTIAEDLTFYFAQSEQIPSSVGLGVLVMPNGVIKQAGGFIIQLLPNADEKIISKLDNNLRKFPNLTDMMDLGHSIENIIENFILKDFQPKIKNIDPAIYKCDCSKTRFISGLKLLSKEELQKAIEINETLSVQCHFCNKNYEFTKSDLQKLVG